MVEKQHTIKQSVSISGTGLHTGQHGTLTFHPAEVNHGIKFRRIDVEGQPIVEAKVANVVDTSRGTTIAQNGVKVYTVEHIMASLRGSGIDNVLIDLNCEEPPILDGSAKIMMNALKEAGVLSVDTPTIQEVRGWVMLMMYRSSQNLEEIAKVAAEI